MNPLTNIEFDILNAIYFVESFDNILAEVKTDENIVKDALRFLIDKKYVTPMKWDKGKNMYVRSFIYDADNMRVYHYLITKAGLTAHNTR